jgi:hypothetical protein
MSGRLRSLQYLAIGSSSPPLSLLVLPLRPQRERPARLPIRACKTLTASSKVAERVHLEGSPAAGSKKLASQLVVDIR